MKFLFLATWQKLSEQEGGSVASRKTARSQRKKIIYEIIQSSF